MKIWVYLNGVQQGPYSYEEFVNLHVDASTPVWYEGLSQWMPASQAAATAPLFNGTQTATPTFAAPAVTTAMPTQPCPPSYIAMSIFILLCCCTPGGILSLVFSAMTRSSYSSGDIAKARRMSEYAQWSIVVSFALGIPLSLITAFLM